jgi:seryl-tRNA synthetase
MTIEQKVEQLELIMAELIADMNQHTALHQKTQAQVKRVYSATTQIGEAVTKQAETMSFMLNEQLQLKEKIDEMGVEITKMNQDIGMILSILRNKN